MIPVGTRVHRIGISGVEIDYFVGMRGTVVGHNPPDPDHGRHLGFNVVQFDDIPGATDWVFGHLGIVPLDAVTLLGEVT